MSPRPGLESAAGKWTILRAGSKDSGGLEIPSFPLSVSTAYGQVRLAIGAGGEARLLLPLGSEQKSIDFDVGNSLLVTVSTFVKSGRSHRFLDLSCHSEELEGVFEEVVDEIVARVSRGADCIDATRSTLDDFRTLLAANIPNRIERTRVAGLVAELVILNRLLAFSPSSWRAWTGPSGDRHDFRVGNSSLEVKASLRAGSTIVTINGISQLEPPSGGTLHLAHLVLEPVAGGLLTISGLARQALTLADGPGNLRDLLAGLGCPDIDAEAWNRDAFRLESESMYRVEEGFPRITPGAFAGGMAPRGIVEVTYGVDLLAASSLRCTTDQAAELLRSLAR